ncbi:MAG: hypothetical protein NT137_01355 [Methanomassiliicoccales archaeon]|nr:hypothetical protein [Methanomassiliicoccales archaeon]
MSGTQPTSVGSEFSKSTKTRKRRKATWYNSVSLAVLIMWTAFFAAIRVTSPGVELEEYRWKVGLYLQISLTILALLAVFMGFYRLRKIEELESARAFFEKGGPAVGLVQAVAAFPLMLRLLAQKIKVDTDDGELKELAENIESVQKTFEELPGHETAEWLIRRQLQDEALKNSLRWCLTVFSGTAVMSIMIVSSMDSLTELTVTDPFYLGLLGALNAMFLFGVIDLLFFLHSALRSFTDLDPIQRALHESIESADLEKMKKKWKDGKDKEVPQTPAGPSPPESKTGSSLEAENPPKDGSS